MAETTSQQIISRVLSEDAPILELKDFVIRNFLLHPSEHLSLIGSPEDWSWSTLGEATEFRAGKTPERGEASFWKEGVHSWLTIADLVDSGEVLASREKITEKARLATFQNAPLPPGTLVMSFKLTIGKISTLGIHAFTNEAIVSISPSDQLRKDFLKLVLPVIARSGDFKGALKGNTLNRNSLGKLRIPIPTIEQQEQFVEIAQRIFGEIEGLRSSLGNLKKTQTQFITSLFDSFEFDKGVHLQGNKDLLLSSLDLLATDSFGNQEFRKFLLNLAFNGFLTKSDVSTWEVKKLKHVGDWAAGATPLKGNPAYYGGNNPWFRSGELMDKLDLTGSEIRITDLAVHETSVKLNKKGNILLAIYGATVGRVAILGEDAFTNQAVLGCTLNDLVDPKYLYWYLIHLRPRFIEQSVGGAQPNLSKVRVELFDIPIPEIATQRAIVQEIDRLWEQVDKISELQIRVSDLQVRLTRSLLMS
jgi:type I restriction enzyme S subunit